VGSFDLSDHPVPTGREEVWRFTPLKRLRGLHADAPLGGEGYDVKLEVPPGVFADGVQNDESERGLSGFVPTDRSRPGSGRSPRAPSRSTCPPRPSSPNRSSSP